MLSTPGGVEISSARFAMSVLPVWGLVATAFTTAAVGDTLAIALMLVWAAVVALAILRGLWSFGSWLFRGAGAAQRRAR